MKYLILFFLIFELFSCQKKENRVVVAKLNSQDSVTIKDTIIYLETDTLFFDYRDSKKYNDFALLHLLKRSYDKDSICSVKYKIDFWKKDKYIDSNYFDFKGYTKGSENTSYYIDSTKTAFKRVGIGYPACGYTQNNFLFYVGKNGAQLIHESAEMGDSGWGTGIDYFIENDEKLIARTYSFWPDEESQNPEENGIVEYSDSIVFTLKANKWKLKKRTPTGKVYKREHKTFNEFHEN